MLYLISEMAVALGVAVLTGVALGWLFEHVMASRLHLKLRSGYESRIATLDADGFNQISLTSGMGRNWQPAWKP